jgi:Sulfotransferase domain
MCPTLTRDRSWSPKLSITRKKINMISPDRPFLTVVSGIPRSGTSLMMRMLESGGMPVLIDQVRGADIDNPRGYYEYEAVKTLKHNASWVAQSSGKAVKMVYLLVYDLPADIEYRVLFMHRNIDEVLASQRVMLERLGKKSTIPDEKMATLFRNHLVKFNAWVKDRPNIQVMDVNYNDMVGDPAPIAAEINRFVGGGLNTEAMVGAVEPSLYRNRTT